jgi:DNA polymerase-1
MVSTGRLSSSDPNLQNITTVRDTGEGKPLNFRAPFVARDPEHKVLTADYSGCELRILAQLSKDPVLVSAFLDELRTGKEADIHSTIATLMFGKEVSKDVNGDLRDITKNLNFGLIYGMGVKKLSAGIGVDIERGKEIMLQYFDTLPGISKYLMNSSRSAVEQGYAETIMGRKRFFDVPDKYEFFRTYEPTEEELEEFDGNRRRAIEDKFNRTIASIERQGKNSPIQGTNGDIIKEALVLIRDYLRRENRQEFITNTVHDEIVIEGPNIEEIAPYVKYYMLQAEANHLDDIPPRISMSIDNCWSK